MTKLGWPVAQPRLTSRPSARTIRRLAIGKDDMIDLRLDVVPGQAADAGDIDLRVKMADIADNSLVRHQFHVGPGDHPQVAGAGDEDVAAGAASSMVTTRYPSMAACRAQMGSISVTRTVAPMPRRAWAQPLPTSP